MLYEIVSKRGKLNGSTIYTLTFIDTEDLTKYECIVDTTYKNYTRCRWNDIIASKAYGLYSNLTRSTRTTNKGTKVIDADSVPQFIERNTHDEMNDYIKAKQRELDKKNQYVNPVFAELFDMS